MDKEIKPNSHKYKEEQQAKTEKRAEKVVTGQVIVKKKSGLQKFAGEFISEDAKNIKEFIFGDVLIPALKKAISDIVTNGIDMILYGGAKPGGRRNVADRVSYSKYSDPNRSYREPRSTTPKYNYDDIVLETRGEAEDVLDRMYEILDSYGFVRVADLYDLVGKTGDYTDNKFGWARLDSAEIVRVREGYWLKLPKAMISER
jgi:hypothetical protein